MKTTELIKKLQDEVKLVGDLDIGTENPVLGYAQEVTDITHDDNNIIIVLNL